MKTMIMNLLLTAYLAFTIVQHVAAQQRLRNNRGDRSSYGIVLPVAPKRRNLQGEVQFRSKPRPTNPATSEDGEEPDSEPTPSPSDEGEDNDILPSNDADQTEGQEQSEPSLSPIIEGDTSEGQDRDILPSNDEDQTEERGPTFAVRTIDNDVAPADFFMIPLTLSFFVPSNDP